jgi:hypothetical protein
MLDWLTTICSETSAIDTLCLSISVRCRWLDDASRRCAFKPHTPATLTLGLPIVLGAPIMLMPVALAAPVAKDHSTLAKKNCA